MHKNSRLTPAGANNKDISAVKLDIFSGGGGDLPCTKHLRNVII